MRVLFLLPGGIDRQLQAIPAVAAVSEHFGAQAQVACAPAAAAAWGLLPAVEKVIPFDFDGDSSLADWANLLGNVREPDFQACINLAKGRQVDLMLSMSHIPTRVAVGGFSATNTVQPDAGWPNQALAAYLRPLGVRLKAADYRLALPKAVLEEAAAALPSGQGPALLLAASGDANDWPAAQWQALPELIRPRLPDLRVVQARRDGALQQRAAQISSCDVVLSSDRTSTELALLLGSPLVALGRSAVSLPERQGVQGLGEPGRLPQLGSTEVLQAMGLA
jgi:ADP-heptose:LPS heptosyltransferase